MSTAKTYKPSNPPASPESLRAYIQKELQKISEALDSVKAVLDALSP